MMVKKVIFHLEGIVIILICKQTSPVVAAPLFISYFHLLGGSPYPLLSHLELVRLLRTSYRMEKPELCSDDV